jgi:hypothetical protein
VTDRQALFVFASPAAARLFVKRLVGDEKPHQPGLKKLAIYVEGEGVIVIDGADEPRDAVIRQLARTSGSIQRVLPRKD